MKILCVAIVAFSLITVCQLAPLTCEQLMKPVDQGPEISGTWYMAAVASDSCLLSVFLDQLNSSSLSLEVTPMDKPNSYMANMTIKLFGYCHEEEGDPMFYNGTVISDDEKGGDQVLLSTGCPDCFVITDKSETITMLALMSRRKTVTADEMKEFDKQAKCHGLAKPQAIIRDTDENCKPFSDEEAVVDDLTVIIRNIFANFSDMFTDYSKCILRTRCPKHLS